MSSKELIQRDAGHFGFSAVKLEDVETDAVTNFSLIVDGSASTNNFRSDIIQGVKDIIEGTKKGPKTETIYVQVLVFARDTQEFHGLKPLEDCNPDDYDSLFDDVKGATTALSASLIRGIESVGNMGKELIDDGYTANGIVAVITDGSENASGSLAPKDDVGTFVRRAKNEISQEEKLESLKLHVVGVNMANDFLKREMEEFRVSCEIPEEDMIIIEELDSSAWAKLVKFISSNVSATSLAQGTGAPSQSISF